MVVVGQEPCLYLWSEAVVGTRMLLMGEVLLLLLMIVIVILLRDVDVVA